MIDPKDARDRAIADFFIALTGLIVSVKPLIEQAVKDSQRKFKP